MSVFWDPIITFSRQKLWNFSLKENYLLLYLWSFWVLLHPGMWHESPVTGPLWTQLCEWTYDFKVYAHLIPTKQVFCTSGSGLPFHSWRAASSPWLPWNCAVLRALSGAAALQHTTRAANGRIFVYPHCYFQTIILTQPYLKTKETLCPFKVSVIGVCPGRPVFAPSATDFSRPRRQSSQQPVLQPSLRPRLSCVTLTSGAPPPPDSGHSPTASGSKHTFPPLWLRFPFWSWHLPEQPKPSSNVLMLNPLLAVGCLPSSPTTLSSLHQELRRPGASSSFRLTPLPLRPLSSCRAPVGTCHLPTPLPARNASSCACHNPRVRQAQRPFPCPPSSRSWGLQKSHTTGGATLLHSHIRQAQSTRSW